MTERDRDDWEPEEVEVSKPVGVVISVRLTSETAERVFELARRQGVPTSAVMREAVERYLSDPVAGVAGSDISFSASNGVQVSLVTGRSRHSRTVGAEYESSWAAV
jgi:hypothetical protein